MCTAATYKTKDFYFGRTFDNEFSYVEEVTVTPRNYMFNFRNAGVMKSHYAMIGIAHIEEGCPLYYDAVNEKGLAMAGLNFVGNACYSDVVKDMDLAVRGMSSDIRREAMVRDRGGNAAKYNVAQFEFIPWIVGQCASVKEARVLLERINITNVSFRDDLPAAQLHWIIADRNEAVTVEAVKEGVRIYDNPVGVLTNNPPFEDQMFQLNNYMYLSPEQPKNTFSKELDLKAYSKGMGAMGLPGDLSSQSRFIRASFVKMNSVSGDSEAESVSQFFHILGSVDQQRGCCIGEGGKYETTIYTSCCNADRGIYYYTTYNNHQIMAVDMYKERLDGRNIIRYELIQDEQIRVQN